MNHPSARCRMAKLLLLFVLICGMNRGDMVGAAHRSSPGENAPVSPLQRAGHAPDAAGLLHLLDSLIVPGLERCHIPGMVVVIVRDSSILLAKGYGFADREAKVPFDPAGTVIRIASLSKLFTGTAVVQLAEQGKLDMNADVNTYLRRFKVEPGMGKPITLQDLLTHTAGFDDRYIGKSARTADEQIPLGEFLARRLPPRINPAGEVYTYSNLSNALAGFVVEEVTGEEYAAYVRRNILMPLGMERSDYRLRPDLHPLLARSYSYGPGGFTTHPFDFINDYPGGQMLSTGEDMAKFMIAHLRLGAYGVRRILSEQSAQAMHLPQFTHHPKLEGAVGYSFGIGAYGKYSILAHDGGYPGVASRLCLFPEIKTGIFMACNIMDGTLIADATRGVLDLLLQEPPPDTARYPLASMPPYDPHIAPFVGTYRHSRYVHTGIEKMGLFMGMGAPELNIGTNDSGMILMSTLTGGIRRMIQTEPSLFRSVDDKYACAFRRDGSGTVTHLFTNGTTAFEKLSWHETIAVQRGLFFGCMAIFAVLAILLPVVRRLRPSGVPASEAPNPIRWYAEKSAAVFLLYILGMGLVVGVITPREELMIGLPYGVHWLAYIMQALPLVGVLLVAGLAGSLFREIVDRVRGRVAFQRGGRLAGTLMLVAGACFTWFLATWNLLGYKF